MTPMMMRAEFLLLKRLHAFSLLSLSSRLVCVDYPDMFIFYMICLIGNDYNVHYIY